MVELLESAGDAGAGFVAARRSWRDPRRGAAALLLALFAGLAAAQPAPAQAAASAAMSEPEVDAWLLRLQDASRKLDYVGTFVVSSAAGALASARIWHVCQNEQQIERVESLTGPRRTVLRHDDHVVMLLPERRVARVERRESLGAFPGLLKSLDTTITHFYSATAGGTARVAGFDAEVVQLDPKDGLRFGYRVWSARDSSLVLKMQTLGSKGEVLEQAAFSELRFDAPVPLDQLARMMQPPDGWDVETPVLSKTTAQALGWTLEQPLPGFRPVQCYERTLGNAADGAEVAASGHGSAMHCVYSDGLASVSLFIEPYGARRDRRPGQMAMGATHTLMRRIGGGESGATGATGAAAGDWWLTAVGEVPLRTLELFGERLRRLKPADNGR